MDQLVDFLVQGLVDHPDDVRVKKVTAESTVMLEVSVHPNDKSLLMGKNGETLNHLRAVLAAASGTKKMVLELVDYDGGATEEE